MPEEEGGGGGGGEQILLTGKFDSGSIQQDILAMAKAAKDGIGEIVGQVGKVAEQNTEVLKAQLAKLNISAKDAVTAAKATLALGKQQVDQHAAEIKLLQQKIHEQVLAKGHTKEEAAEHAKVHKELQAELVTLQKQQAERKGITDATKKYLAELQQVQKAEADHVRQMARVEKEHQKEAALSTRGAQPSSGLLGVISGALLGRGLAGSIAGGVAAGAGLMFVLEKLVGGLERFADKVKQTTIESGNLVSVWDVFQKLAAGQGIEPAKAMADLVKATEGEVSQLTLLRAMNAGLKSDLKMSMSDIMEMSRSLTHLAEASGKYTPEQAIQRFTHAMAMGRPYILAPIVGLTPTQLRGEQMSPALSRAERMARQWQITREAMKREEEKLGEKPLPLDAMLDRQAKAQKSLWQMLGAGITTAPGTQVFFKQWSEMIEKIWNMGPKMFAFGQTVGDALSFIGSAALATVPVLEKLWDVLHSFGEVIRGMFSGLEGKAGEATGIGKGADVLVEKFRQLHPVMFTVTQLVMQMSLYFQQALTYVGYLLEKMKEGQGLLRVLGLLAAGAFGMARAGPGGALIGMGLAAKAQGTTGASLMEDLFGETEDEKQARKNESRIAGPKPSKTSQNLPLPTPAQKLNMELENQRWTMEESLRKLARDRLAAEARLAEQQKMNAAKEEQEATRRQILDAARSEMELKKALADLDLQRTKAALEEQREVEDTAYADGERSLRAHIAVLVGLAEKRYEATVAQLKAHHEAELRWLEVQREQEVFGGAGSAAAKAKYEVELKKLALKQTKELEAAEETRRKETYQIARPLREDARAAERRQINEDLKVEQDAVKQTQKATEWAYNAREISATEYYQRTMQLTGQSAENEMRHALRVYEVSKKTDDDRLALTHAMNDVIMRSQDELDDKLRGAVQKQVSAMESFFQPRIQVVQERVQYEQTAPPEERSTARIEEQLALLQQVLETQRQIYTQQLLSDEALAAQPDEWLKVYSAVERINSAQRQNVEELRKIHDLVPDIAHVMEGLTKSAGQVFGSRWAQNFLSTISAGWKAIEQMTERGRILRGGTPSLPPEQKAIMGMAEGFVRTAGQGAAELKVKFSDLEKESTSVVSSLQRFAEALAIYADAIMRMMGSRTPGIEPVTTPVYKIPPGVDRLHPEGLELGRAVTGAVITEPLPLMQPPKLDLRALLPSSAGLGMKSLATLAREAQAAPIAAPPEAPAKVPGLIETMTATGGLMGMAGRTLAVLATPVTLLVKVFERMAGSADNAAKQLDKVTASADESGQAAGGGVAGTVGKTRTVLGTIFGKTDASGGKISAKDRINAIGALAGGVGDFVNTIGQAKGTVTGAVGGAMSGMSLGMAVGGPIGAAVGAAGGAILGGITGHKRAEVKRQIDEMNKAYKDVMLEFARNTNNLNDTIVKITGLLARAQELQNSSKKGKSEYQQVIDQYIDQINQLKTQQADLMRTLDQQLAVLTQPQGVQQYLNNLVSVRKQFEQFIGAASTLGQVQKAWDFLNASLQSYAFNLEQTMMQDQEGAINDALRLMDLEKQRRDLLLQTSQQMQDVLGQGALTRARTMAMTKGAQIWEIQYNLEKQKAQLDRELSAATYRVHAESQIYDLATTRVGLETQLLGLQNLQTRWDMERISMLRDLFTHLAAGDWAYGPLKAIKDAVQQATVNVPGYTPGSNPTMKEDILDDFVAGAYQDRSILGFASFRGQNL